MDKPTPEGITRLYEVLRDKVYRTMHQNMREWRKLHVGDIACQQPKGWPTHIPSTGAERVRMGVNQLVSDNIVLEVEAASESLKDKANAESIQQFCDKCIHDWDLMNDTPVWRECGYNMVLYGMAAVKGPLFDKNVWGKAVKGGAKEEVEKREFLKRTKAALILKALDPLVIFPDPAGRFIIEAYKRFAGEVKEDIARWNRGKARLVANTWGVDIDDYEEVSWVEFYSADWRCFLVASGRKPMKSAPIIDVQPNLYGFIPYAWAYSGWGKGSPDGVPDEKAVGILSGIESDIQAEARALTALDNHLRAHVYQRVLAPLEHERAIRANISNDPASVSFIPAEAMPAQAGGMQLWPEPRISPDLYGYISLVQRDMEYMTGNRALTGAGAVSESGLKAMTRIRQGGLNMRPPRRALENMIGNSLRNCLQLIKNVIDEPIPITGKVSLKPENISEPVNIQVKLEPQDPEEDREMIEIGLRLLERRAITIQQFHEDYLKSNRGSKILSELLAEGTLLSDPNLRAALAAKGLEELGIREATEAMTAEGGQRVQGGRPRAPIPEPSTQQRLRAAPEEMPVRTEGMGIEGMPGGGY